MSTPTEETWEGVSQLPEFKKSYYRFTKDSLNEVLENYMDAQGIRVLRVRIWRLQNLTNYFFPLNYHPR